MDSIRIAYKQMLLVKDTVYFGVMDSVVALPKGTEYKIQRNFLLRNNVFYEKKPHKKEQVIERMELYSEIWNKAYSYSTKDTTKKVDNNFVNTQTYFMQYEGKVIRSISFNAVDMFEGEVEDTTITASNIISKALNKTHINTRKQVIRNNLRFKENDKIEALRMSENERLLRQLKYIQDARIMVQQENLLSDSVDLVIITQDRLPYGVSVDISDYDEYALSPYTTNFLGQGDYLEAGIHFNGGEDEIFGYNIKYQAKNLFGSFVDIGAYRLSNYEKDNYGVDIERNFLTTDMRFGGAFKYDNIQQTRSYESEVQDTVLKADYQVDIVDFWIGRTFVLSPTGERPNISISARSYDEIYSKRPTIKSDSNLVFHDWNLSLASIMIQKVSFFQTKKLAEFGTTEDIPVGYSFKFTTGYNWNTYNRRPYAGFDFRTNIVRPKSGFLGLKALLGVFYQNEKFEDTYGDFEFTYFAPLKSLGRFEYRHILVASSELLFNERYNKPLELNNRRMGVIQNGIETNSTLALEYKPNIFLPTSILGFNFSVAPFSSIGFATNDQLYSGKSNIYSVHGVTLRCKNESLIFPMLGFDMRYYPTYGSKNNKFKFEAYLKDTKLFENLFSPKPVIIRSY